MGRKKNRTKILSLLLPQHTSETPQYIADANTLGARALFGLFVSFFQPLCRRAQHALGHTLCRLSVLLDFVDAVCEEIDVGFERVGERSEVRL